jgi:hypothetical protein
VGRGQRETVRTAGFTLLVRRHVDPVLDHPTLERVAGDTEELCGFHDAAALLEGLQTEEALGFAEVEVFQKNRHARIVREIELVEKRFFVRKTTRTSVPEWTAKGWKGLHRATAAARTRSVCHEKCSTAPIHHDQSASSPRFRCSARMEGYPTSAIASPDVLSGPASGSTMSPGR